MRQVRNITAEIVKPFEESANGLGLVVFVEVFYDRQSAAHNPAPSFMPRGRTRPMANY